MNALGSFLVNGCWRFFTRDIIFLGLGGGGLKDLIIQLRTKFWYHSAMSSAKRRKKSWNFFPKKIL